jgi:hypothetical protein
MQQQLERGDEEEDEPLASSPSSLQHRQASDFNQRTRKMYSLLRQTFTESSSSRRKSSSSSSVTVTVTHASLLEHTSSESSASSPMEMKRKAAAVFYEMLVLKTHDYVQVQQERPYADIGTISS